MADQMYHSMYQYITWITQVILSNIVNIRNIRLNKITSVKCIHLLSVQLARLSERLKFTQKGLMLDSQPGHFFINHSEILQFV